MKRTALLIISCLLAAIAVRLIALAVHNVDQWRAGETNSNQGFILVFCALVFGSAGALTFLRYLSLKRKI